MYKYAIIKSARGYELATVIKTFKERAEANYYITDVYGPESSQYQVVELLTYGDEVKSDPQTTKIVNIGDFIHEE